MRKQVTRTIDQSAGGADWSFVPSTGDSTRLLAITAQLATTATVANRAVVLEAVDLDGLLLDAMPSADATAASKTARYVWDDATTMSGASSDGLLLTQAVPRFWLPPGTTVRTATSNLDPKVADVQAHVVTTGHAVTVPATIVTGTSDEFVWTGTGGAGSPQTFVIAAGTYSTAAALAAALNAAVDGAIVFSTLATVAIDATSKLVTITAVADTGTAGNGDTFGDGSHSSFTVMFGSAVGPFTLAGGVNADVGDQWSNVVATFLTADRYAWLETEALIARLSGGTG